MCGDNNTPIKLDKDKFEQELESAFKIIKDNVLSEEGNIRKTKAINCSFSIPNFLKQENDLLAFLFNFLIIIFLVRCFSTAFYVSLVILAFFVITVIWLAIVIIDYFVTKLKTEDIISRFQKEIEEKYKNLSQVSIGHERTIVFKEQSLNQDNILDYIKICFTELMEEIKNENNRTREFSPFIALFLVWLVVDNYNISQENLEKKYFYALIAGASGFVVLLYQSLRIVFASDSKELFVCKKCLSTIEKIQFANKIVNKENEAN